MSMLDPQKLVAVFDKAAPAAVRVAPEGCLNRRHRESHCEACLACPTGAITPVASSVRVDAGACEVCGLCYSVCPSGAFSVKGPALADIVRLVADWRGEALEIVCPRHSPAEQTATDATAILTVPCLAWVSRSLALALAATGVRRIYLDDRQCSECKLGSARTTFLAQAAAAQTTLDSLGRAVKIQANSETSVGGRDARNVPVLDPTRPAYSRRDLFSAFRRGLAQTAATATEGALPLAAEARPAPRVPVQRLLLTSALAKLAAGRGGVDPEPRVPVSAVAVGIECTACGLCAKVCPSGAMEMALTETHYALSLNVAKCLGRDCMLCGLICPVKAISGRESLPIGQAVAQQSVLQREGTLVPCSRCGVPVAQTQGEPLCHVCQWTRGAAERAASGEAQG